ncbi:biotin transporter BioY [Rhodobacteraceae bacterium RKSG542]|uniref:biotin transporter BioY n=1 Tax=Pseudovibrio flavus TaxID=2529854 RepID=UPI0012BCE2E5|nr:biotin transporter BioY [Pseudovibrio flavus]MTI16859.1 biotin transporter BioY [Pseudovibrio flavus]
MNTRDTVLVALFAAFTVALAFFPPITIPLVGVPITAQSLGVMLAGAVLGANRGALSMGLVLALVAVGLPVLAGGRGGLGVFMGPTAGYLVGWPLAAYATGLLFERFSGKANYLVFSSLFCIVGGIFVMHPVGVLWLSISGGIPLDKAVLGTLVFVPGDVLKAVAAAYIAIQVRKALGATMGYGANRI